jgi:hypothetical protein
MYFPLLVSLQHNSVGECLIWITLRGRLECMSRESRDLPLQLLKGAQTRL